MAFSGVGADDPLAALPGGAKKVSVSPEVFLIANLNRFKGPTVPAGQRLGETPFPVSAGISSDVAFDALTVINRRLQSSLSLISDDTTRQLLAAARAVLTSGDTGGDALVIQFVKARASELGVQVAAFADSLGLPPASFPGDLPFGLSIKTVAIAGVGLAAAFLLWRRR
jgi:hypothetical protein